jgi:hypothetical protein
MAQVTHGGDWYKTTWDVTKGENSTHYSVSYIHATGTTSYYKDGKLHREDGPAIMRGDGDDEYWINGVFVDPISTLIDEIEALDETR